MSLFFVKRDGMSSPRIVVVGMHADHRDRDPDTLLEGAWPDFGLPAAAVRRTGLDVAIVQAASRDATREIQGVPCHFVHGDRRLFSRIDALSPDIVHVEGLILPHKVRALRRAFSHARILAQDHGTRCPAGWRRMLYRWGFAPLAGVAFSARAQAAPFVTARIFPASLPVFEVTEVSSTFRPGDRAAARSASGLEGDPCLFWAGNLDANKDPLCVLNAVGLAAQHVPGLRLYMAFRQAPLLDAVRARIAEDGILGSRVRLLGTVAHGDLERYFRSADLFVQASHVESAGAAIIEAFACGTSPVVTDIPSFRRFTGDGVYGGLAPVGDSQALARAILEWAQRDRDLLRRRARERFEEELSFDAIGRQLAAAYHALWSPP